MWNMHADICGFIHPVSKNESDCEFRTEIRIVYIFYSNVIIEIVHKRAYLLHELLRKVAITEAI